LTLLVITLDRLLTILLPFHIAFRLTYTSARMMMLCIWLFVLLIALAPFLPFHYFDNFYGRSGVCLALHITPQRFPGWEYSIFIFLALNMLACILIILSYCAMYAVALKTGKAVQPSPQKNRKESRLARRMIVIILTNLACYLPISVMSLLALADVSIPEEVIQSINQSINRRINQSIDRSLHQSINQSTDQSIYRSIASSINQSIEGLMNDLFNQLIDQAIN
jgi:relaxin family peptide receptor 2